MVASPAAVVALGIGLLMLSGCGGAASTSTSPPTTTPVVSVPGAPVIGTATPGNASASIAFTAPAATGGATITAYTATCTAGGSVSASGASSPIAVTGLVNGTAYACTVTATNSAGIGPASASVGVTPANAGGISTAAFDCPTFISSFNNGIGLNSTASWTCTTARRTLVANGIPDHPAGTFPNPNNPNSITAQSVNFSATLTPAMAAAINTTPMLLGYARNGVKFDPGTAGSCPTGATSTMQCGLADNSGAFRIEALGQSSFNFGTDASNAHVQPNGAYHYHGMPEGLLANGGVTSAAPKMLLVGYAPDGYPVYARYGRTIANDGASALKVMRGSYSLKAAPDTGRPAVTLIPMGAFLQDYQYVAGSGDLDECNGRSDVTPEFPTGIYHYYATDTYPFLPRCWKGVVS